MGQSGDALASTRPQSVFHMKRFLALYRICVSVLCWLLASANRLFLICVVSNRRANMRYLCVSMRSAHFASFSDCALYALNSYLVSRVVRLCKWARMILILLTALSFRRRLRLFRLSALPIFMYDLCSFILSFYSLISTFSLARIRHHTVSVSPILLACFARYFDAITRADWSAYVIVRFSQYDHIPSAHVASSFRTV